MNTPVHESGSNYCALQPDVSMIRGLCFWGNSVTVRHNFPVFYRTLWCCSHLKAGNFLSLKVQTGKAIPVFSFKGIAYQHLNRS